MTPGITAMMSEFCSARLNVVDVAPAVCRSTCSSQAAFTVKVIVNYTIIFHSRLPSTKAFLIILNYNLKPKFSLR